MRKQPAWMRQVKVGDFVSRDGGQTQRVVRHVSFFKNGDLACVDFAIKRCSWTTRCYTTMSYNDLRYFGYAPLGVRVALCTRMDRRIARDIAYENRFDQKVTCCDVHGVA